MANNAMNNYYGILGSAAGAMATGAAELYGGANIPGRTPPINPNSFTNNTRSMNIGLPGRT
jgi:hypothetical protein